MEKLRARVESFYRQEAKVMQRRATIGCGQGRAAEGDDSYVYVIYYIMQLFM